MGPQVNERQVRSGPRDSLSLSRSKEDHAFLVLLNVKRALRNLGKAYPSAREPEECLLTIPNQVEVRRSLLGAMGGRMVLWAALVVAVVASGVEANLSVGFYSKSCPNVETIVFNQMKAAYNSDKTVAPGVLRLVYHDCMVRGCDGSVLLDGPRSEKTAAINAALHGFEVIDVAKAAVEKACPGVVSCADILAFASRDSVKLTGGQGWAVPAGRMDGFVSNAAEPAQELPLPFMKVDQLLPMFAKKGLTAQQMVTLAGAHTIGKSHCQNIKDRIYTNACPTRVDPFLPQLFYESLMKQCPSISSNNAIDMEYVSPGKFDVAYFQTLADHRGLHTSDQDYVMNPKTWVHVYDNLKEDQFSANFAQAMVALTNVEVLTGTAGQIRKHCRFVN